MTIYQAKWPDSQGHIDWTEQENETWRCLITRQCNTIQGRACPAFIDGLHTLCLAHDRVPQLAEVNAKVKVTGWRMQAVAGTIAVDAFFEMLKQRVFPVANFIRIPQELDYLKQPDVFHELFGHAPLLLNQSYADFLQWYGTMALTVPPMHRKTLSRLFWYTIEFGLIATSDGIRIIGGGILSSHKETMFAVSDQPTHHPFDVLNILKTDYDYQQIQKQYFVLDDFSQLYACQHDETIQHLLGLVDGATQQAFVNC